MRPRLATLGVGLVVGGVVLASLVDALGGHASHSRSASTQTSTLDTAPSTAPPRPPGPVEAGGTVVFSPYAGAGDLGTGLYAVSPAGTRSHRLIAGDLCCPSWSRAGRCARLTDEDSWSDSGRGHPARLNQTPPQWGSPVEEGYLGRECGRPGEIGSHFGRRVRLTERSTGSTSTGWATRADANHQSPSWSYPTTARLLAGRQASSLLRANRRPRLRNGLLRRGRRLPARPPDSRGHDQLVLLLRVSGKLESRRQSDLRSVCAWRARAGW